MAGFINVDTAAIEAAVANYANLRRQLPFVIARALSWTANDVRAAQREMLPRIFDRPTRFTLDSLYTQPATKQSLSAAVGVKPVDVKRRQHYLLPQVFGGPRRQKASERALRGFFVPSDDIRLNSYGNVYPGDIKRILSAVGADREAGYLANQTARSKKRNPKRKSLFRIAQGSDGGLHPGIYERDRKFTFKNGQRRAIIRPMLIQVSRAPQYQPRYPFFDSGSQQAREAASKNLNKSLAVLFGR